MGGVAAIHGWAGSLISLFVKSFNLVYLFVGYFCAIFLLYPMCQTISGGCESWGFRMDRIQGFLKRKLHLKTKQTTSNMTTCTTLQKQQLVSTRNNNVTETT
jgi:hypothetical protein